MEIVDGEDLRQLVEVLAHLVQIDGFRGPLQQHPSCEDALTSEALVKCYLVGLVAQRPVL